MENITNKGTKKELPLLIGDLNINAAALEKIKAVQDEFSSRFEKNAEEAKAKSLKRYTSKIESLLRAKSEMIKEYNAEIRKYRTLINDLETPVKKTVPKTAPKKKTETKKAPPKKK